MPIFYKLSLILIDCQIQCNPLLWNGSRQPLYPEKPYKRDSPIPIPIPIHTQESGPGDRALYADILCI